MKFSLDIKYFSILTLGFILFTAIGTITHEYGHIMVARSLGYETTLHYGSMNFQNPDLNERLHVIYNENKSAIENSLPFDDKAEYENGIQRLRSDGILVNIGGPLQTTLTGTIGFLILLFRKKKIRKSGLNLIDWLAVFLSLFWLRQVFNVVVSVGEEMIYPNGSYFDGDERYISYTLDLWPGTISTLLCLIGLAVVLFVVFKVIPRELRLTFIISGLIGGISGFVIWMNVLGPQLLP